MTLFGKFHIIKRPAVSAKLGIAVRALAIASALLVCSVIIIILSKKDPIKVFAAMLDGAFGSSLRLWSLFQNLAILLCISLAVTPAFKLRFWNCGAEGQVLISGLATVLVMVFLGNVLPSGLLIVAMAAASILAGILWAVIPAFCKARWNTNETLFTLMMNYVAIQLVAYFLKYYVKSGSGVLAPLKEFGLPIVGHDYLLNIIIVAVLTVVIYIYLRFTKHGYELSVVGESENTARYVGINVKKVIIRTLVLSGALCGVAGLLIVGGTDYTISTTTVSGRGFTAIMVSWLAKFNPLYMVLTTFLIVFLDRGAQQVSTTFRLDSAISDIVTGIILLFIIGCEFFLQYKIVPTKSGKGND